jgi:hypothetical protein
MPDLQTLIALRPFFGHTDCNAGHRTLKKSDAKAVPSRSMKPTESYDRIESGEGWGVVDARAHEFRLALRLTAVFCYRVARLAMARAQPRAAA